MKNFTKGLKILTWVAIVLIWTICGFAQFEPITPIINTIIHVNSIVLTFLAFMGIFSSLSIMYYRYYTSKILSEIFSIRVILAYSTIIPLVLLNIIYPIYAFIVLLILSLFITLKSKNR